MAPLVVIRGGSKYVEYRETRAEWMRLQHFKLHESACNSNNTSNNNNDTTIERDLDVAFARAAVSIDARSTSRDDLERVSDSESDDDHERLRPHRHSRFRFGRRELHTRSDSSSGAAAYSGDTSIETFRNEGDEDDTDNGSTLTRLSSLSTTALGLSTDLFAHDGMRGFHCADCGNLVADRDDIVAKSFFGRTGKAFLMNSMFNVVTGSPRSRYLMTGMHTIADVSCSICASVLGWKYVKAMEASQKYKEGKFIVEKALVQDTAEEQAWQRR